MRQTVPRIAGFTYLFATDSKRAKSCSGWSVCGSKSIEFLMMSKACMFHRGSKGITYSSGLKNKTRSRILELNSLPRKFQWKICTVLIWSHSVLMAKRQNRKLLVSAHNTRKVKFKCFYTIFFLNAKFLLVLKIHSTVGYKVIPLEHKHSDQYIHLLRSHCWSENNPWA